MVFDWGEYIAIAGRQLDRGIRIQRREVVQHPVFNNETKVLCRPFGCYSSVVCEPAIEIIVAGVLDKLATSGAQVRASGEEVIDGLQWSTTRTSGMVGILDSSFSKDTVGWCSLGPEQ